MKWSEICSRYPSRFVLVEAIKAVSKNRLRTIEEMTVVGEYDNPKNAWEGYKLLHRQHSEREFYIFHTSKKEVEAIEEFVIGI